MADIVGQRTVDDTAEDAAALKFGRHRMDVPAGEHDERVLFPDRAREIEVLVVEGEPCLPLVVDDFIGVFAVFDEVDEKLHGVHRAADMHFFGADAEDCGGPGAAPVFIGDHLCLVDDGTVVDRGKVQHLHGGGLMPGAGHIDGLFPGQKVAGDHIHVHRLELLIGEQTQRAEINAGLRLFQGLDGLVGLAAVRGAGVDDEMPVHAPCQRVEVDIVVRDLPEHVLMEMTEPFDFALIVLHELPVAAVLFEQRHDVLCCEAVIKVPVDGADEARRRDLLCRLRHECTGLWQFIAMSHLERKAVRGRHALKDIFIENWFEQSDVPVDAEVVPHVVGVQPADGDRVAVHAPGKDADPLCREVFFKFLRQEVDEFRQVLSRQFRHRPVRFIVLRLLLFLIGAQDLPHIDALVPAEVPPDEADLAVKDGLQFRHLLGVFGEDALELFVVPEGHVEVRRVLFGVPVFFQDRLFEGRPVRAFLGRVFGDVRLPVVVPHLLFGLCPEVLHVVFHKPLEHSAVFRHRSHLLIKIILYTLSKVFKKSNG